MLLLLSYTTVQKAKVDTCILPIEFHTSLAIVTKMFRVGIKQTRFSSWALSL